MMSVCVNDENEVSDVFETKAFEICTLCADLVHCSWRHVHWVCPGLSVLYKSLRVWIPWCLYVSNEDEFTDICLVLWSCALECVVCLKIIFSMSCKLDLDQEITRTHAHTHQMTSGITERSELSPDDSKKHFLGKWQVHDQEYAEWGKILCFAHTDFHSLHNKSQHRKLACNSTGIFHWTLCIDVDGSSKDFVENGHKLMARVKLKRHATYIGSRIAFTVQDNVVEQRQKHRIQKLQQFDIRCLEKTWFWRAWNALYIFSFDKLDKQLYMPGCVKTVSNNVRIARQCKFVKLEIQPCTTLFHVFLWLLVLHLYEWWCSLMRFLCILLSADDLNRIPLW